VFDASNNQLTGPLPFSLGCLDKADRKELISGGRGTCNHGNHLSSDFGPLGL
jgi:hypothetical protein